jgi:hypothetical protein
MRNLTFKLIRSLLRTMDWYNDTDMIFFVIAFPFILIGDIAFLPFTIIASLIAPKLKN